MVGIAAGRHSGFGYDEVPELVAAAEWVRTLAPMGTWTSSLE